jgi:hypothetical protein
MKTIGEKGKGTADEDEAAERKARNESQGERVQGRRPFLWARRMKFMNCAYKEIDHDG